jgi:hypothetical protein
MTNGNDMEFKIPILVNAGSDLAKFNFSLVDIKIYDIQSNKFRRFIKDLNPSFYGGNISFFNEIINEKHSANDKKYAIVKNSYFENYSDEEIFDVFYLLKIIFPSELDISHIVNFKIENDFVQRISMTTLAQRYCPESKYLFCEVSEFKKINNYIKLVFNNLKTKNYIESAIENYQNSFNASHLHFSFIALCISLENLIDARHELTYRLKRLISIICGDNPESCSRIFKNIGEIYNLRSEIVHGGKVTDKKIYEFYEYLQSIVSLTIIELLIHDVSDNIELNKIINTLGFGQRKDISKNWKRYDINSKTLNKIHNIELKSK